MALKAEIVPVGLTNKIQIIVYAENQEDRETIRNFLRDHRRWNGNYRTDVGYVGPDNNLSVEFQPADTSIDY